MYDPPNHQMITADMERILEAELPWQALSGKEIVVTGASGMLAGYVVDTLLLLPEYYECDPPRVTALVRNREKASARFAHYLGNPFFRLRTDDLCERIDAGPFLKTALIIHAASIPRPDGKTPVDVMAPNILGTWNLLELVRGLPEFDQFVYFSSGIVNGEDIKSDIPVSEDMFFPTSCTNPASCYSESKRAGETISLSFMRQYGIPVKLLRHFGSYGPGMDLYNDPRAFTSFVKNAVCGEDIILHSTGEETRFWCYISDATEAFFRVLFEPIYGEAWNVANDEAGCTILELAQTAAELAPGKKVSVRFDPSKVPAGYTPFKSHQITVPDIKKLRNMGFSPRVGIREGLQRTIQAYSPA